jgi:uncharacterized membrane protein
MLTILLPPVPPYEGLHPIVVHFPIALLLSLPVLVLLAAAWKDQAAPILTAALVLCVLGVMAAFLATSTGEATEKFAKGVAGADRTLHEHEELAEFARNLFCGVGVVLTGLTMGAWKLRARLSVAARVVGLLMFLVVWGFAAGVLVNAAHEGGKLVHLHGVRAPLAGPGEDPAH